MTELATSQQPDAAAHLHAEAADPRPAFDDLYGTCEPLLRKIAIRKFGVPPRDAEDLVHDVFATYLANRANVFDPKAYLIGAICNASRQYWRKDEASPFCDAPDECAAAPDEALTNGVIRNLLVGATLRQLGERCRETLQRFYLRGETTLEIARSRDTTSNYICRLLNYCRNRARALYARMSEGSG